MQNSRFAFTFAVVVSLFASAGAIGQEPMQPRAPQFSRFVSKEGRFRIMFPGQPQFETKELTGGFALVEVKSREEAIEWAKRFRKIVGDGDSMIQEVFGG